MTMSAFQVRISRITALFRRGEGFKNVIQTIRENVPPARRFKPPLKFLLMLRLVAFWRLHLNPHELTIDHADDVGTAKRAEPIEMLICVSEAAAIISIVKDASEHEVVKNAALYVGFFQEYGI